MSWIFSCRSKIVEFSIKARLWSLSQQACLFMQTHLTEFFCFGVVDKRWGHADYLMRLPSSPEDLHVEVYATGLQAQLRKHISDVVLRLLKFGASCPVSFF